MPIKKELDNGKTITYKVKFIDSFRFMLTSSKLVDNLSEIYSKKCRGKKCESECEFKEFKNNKPINGLIKINEIRNKCIEIYELDPAHFLSAPRLAWEAYLKKKIFL